MESGRGRDKILIIGARASARDNVRVLVGTMGCSSAFAATLEEVLPLVEREKPGVAILDLQPLSR